MAWKSPNVFHIQEVFLPLTWCSWLQSCIGGLNQSQKYASCHWGSSQMRLKSKTKDLKPPTRRSLLSHVIAWPQSPSGNFRKHKLPTFWRCVRIGMRWLSSIASLHFSDLALMQLEIFKWLWTTKWMPGQGSQVTRSMMPVPAQRPGANANSGLIPSGAPVCGL